VTVEVTLDRAEVRSRSEVYDFLLEELPFTSGACRELGRAKYEVFRDPEDPETEEEREAWRRTYYLNDHEGLRVKVELVLAEPNRRVFYTWGSYDLAVLPRIWGRSVIVVVWEEKEDALVTEARIFAQVHSTGYRAISGLMKGVVADTVRDKSAVFIRAARWVAEEVAKDPEKLYTEVNGSRHLDKVDLERFRKRFVE